MENTYWNHKGKFAAFAEKLEAMIPAEGIVPKPHKNKALEKFRKACNCYYDLYNNGLCNRGQQFAKVFGIRWTDYRNYRRDSRGIHCIPYLSQRLYELTETKMDEIILDAAVEQGICPQN